MNDLFTSTFKVSYKGTKSLIFAKCPSTGKAGISAASFGRLIEGLNAETVKGFALLNIDKPDIAFKVKIKGWACNSQNKYMTHLLLTPKGVENLCYNLNINLDSELINFIYTFCKENKTKQRNYEDSLHIKKSSNKNLSRHLVYLWKKIAEMEQKQLKYLIELTEPKTLPESYWSSDSTQPHESHKSPVSHFVKPPSERDTMMEIINQL